MADPANTGIYEIVNLVNGKRYIGSARNIGLRWRRHCSRLRAGQHHSRHLQAAWGKYGEDSFECRPILVCKIADLITYEQIAFDAFSPEYNVNPRAASSLGRRFTEETKAKIAAKAVGRKCPPRSAEHRAKLSAANKGRAKSPEHIAALQRGRAKRVYTQEQRMLLARKIREQYDSGIRNRERPAEYREKIAASLRGKKLSQQHRENAARGRRKSKVSDDEQPSLFADRHQVDRR